MVQTAAQQTGEGDETTFEARIGLSCRFGTERMKLGLIGGLSLRRAGFQLNTIVGWDWHWRDLGPRDAHQELRVGIGASAAFGNETILPEYASSPNNFISPVRNGSAKPYSMGYGFLWYINPIGTAQQSGIVELEIQRFIISHENDIFIGKASDKFRTASLFLGYRLNESRLGVSSVLWHGDSREEGRNWVYESDFYKSRHGYIDLSKTKFGHLSHGIFAFEWTQELNWNQSVGVAIGMDSDRVRHLWQNKLVHDMPWWPRNWEQPKNPHIPMIADDGKPFLFRDGQRVRPARFFLEGFSNQSSLY